MTTPASVCDYEILAELGRGTTGVVYKARHSVVKPDRLVALKMPFLGSPSETARRFSSYQNEWNVLRVLTWEPDPAVPTLYNVVSDVSGQLNFYLREFVSDTSLEQLVVTGSLCLSEGIRILSTIANAVQRMHGHWIAHRNLRPSRVLVGTDGTAKLIGFGHVAPLVGAAELPPGESGVSAKIDIRALQEMLGWLCTTLRQPLPA
ncbi:MAG: protein kinase [Gemmataceae bacterium]|nr:protein kinase [Gemmataceae bacterium]